jgi:hypothetical protein
MNEETNTIHFFVILPRQKNMKALVVGIDWPYLTIWLLIDTFGQME